MGFELKHQKIVFGPEDDRYDGLIVTMNELSIGALTALDGLSDENAEGQKASLAAMVGLLGRGDPDADPPITRGIRSWNYTRDGEPVPVSPAELAALGIAVITKIIGEWQEQAKVSDPLERRSSVGVPSVEVSIPMDVPSLSPENLRRLASTADSSPGIPPTLSAHYSQNPPL